MLRPLMIFDFAATPDEAALAALQTRLKQDFAVTATVAGNPVATRLNIFAGCSETEQVAALYGACRKSTAAATQLIDEFGITGLACADDTHNRARIPLSPRAAYGSKATPTAPSA